VESGLAAQRARRGAALQAGPGSPFRGRLRARVVVADLNAAGGKDYVVYQVRVGDDVGEWTVARRSESNPVRRSLSLTTPILNVKDMLSDVTKSAVQASTDAVLDSASVFKAGLKKGRALPIFPSSSSLTSRGASGGSSLSHAGWKSSDPSFDEAHGDHTAIQAADAALRRERGVSAPLYELVDCVFQLATRGFFRRQVFAVARQVLSLVAGTTIDEYLTARLRSLRSEHTIGRAIAGIQAALWPGGVWYQATPQYRAVQGGWVREAVAQLLLTCAPATLVGLVGKSAYTSSGMEDVIEMMQSETLILQLGYGALEILAVHLMPELKPLFLSLKHGGLGRPDADEDGPDM
ncbi:hypothetical protein APUTEX25_002136, partial [Auxenochlorella protothecoides]